MKRRVVITGMGAVTPIGNTIEEFWDGIRSGKSGIAPITHFDASEYKVKLAAEVKNFVAKERMDFKAAKRMESFSQYAVAAAKEAFEDAGLDMAEEDPYRIGTIIGSGIGGGAWSGTRESIDDSVNDLQYGSRKCINPAWTERKMYRCSDCLCFRGKQHRRCYAGNPVWRS